MSSTPHIPMDVFSTYMDIPFDIAAYCRGHKFSQEAVDLGKAIRARQEADRGIRLAEMVVERAESRYREAISTMRIKMERDPL